MVCYYFSNVSSCSNDCIRSAVKGFLGAALRLLPGVKNACFFVVPCGNSVTSCCLLVAYNVVPSFVADSQGLLVLSRDNSFTLRELIIRVSDMVLSFG